MDHMPILAVLFQSIPESFIIINLAMALIGEKAEKRQILLIAILAAISSYIIRSQFIPFGIHSAIITCFLFIFTKIISKKKTTLKNFNNFLRPGKGVKSNVDYCSYCRR